MTRPQENPICTIERTHSTDFRSPHEKQAGPPPPSCSSCFYYYSGHEIDPCWSCDRTEGKPAYSSKQRLDYTKLPAVIERLRSERDALKARVEELLDGIDLVGHYAADGHTDGFQAAEQLDLVVKGYRRCPECGGLGEHLDGPRTGMECDVCDSMGLIEADDA